MGYGNVTRRFCGTSADDTSTGTGTVAWSQATTAGDGVAGNVRDNTNANQAYASLAPAAITHWLKCTNFGFNSGVGAVSTGATLVGIRVIIHGGQMGDDATENTNLSVAVSVCKVGAIDGTGFTAASPIVKCTGIIEATYGVWVGAQGTDGVPNELAGSTLSAANVRASDFGVFIKFTNGDGSLTSKVVVDSVIVELIWSETATVRLTSTTAGAAPRWIAVSATESSVGARDPRKCEFRWTVTGPEGWAADASISDPRQGADVNGQARTPSDLVGWLCGFPGTRAGDYTITCDLYDESNNLLDTDSVSITLTAESGRTGTKYIDYVSGNDTTGDGSASLPWKTLEKAAASAVSNSNIYVVGGQTTEFGTVTFTQSNLNIAPKSGTGTATLKSNVGTITFQGSGCCLHDFSLQSTNNTDEFLSVTNSVTGCGVWNLDGTGYCFGDFWITGSGSTNDLCGSWNCTNIEARYFHLFPAEATRQIHVGLKGTSLSGSSANGFSRAEGGGNNSTGTRGYTLAWCYFDGTSAARGGMRTGAQFVTYYQCRTKNALFHVYRLSSGGASVLNCYMHVIDGCDFDAGTAVIPAADSIPGQAWDPQWTLIKNTRWYHINNNNAYIAFYPDVYQFSWLNSLTIVNNKTVDLDGGGAFVLDVGLGYRLPNQAELVNNISIIADANGSANTSWAYLRDYTSGAYAGGGTKLFKTIKGCFWPSGDITNATRYVLEGSSRAFDTGGASDFVDVAAVISNGKTPVLSADLTAAANFGVPNNTNNEKTTCVPFAGVQRDYRGRLRDHAATNWWVGITDDTNTSTPPVADISDFAVQSLSTSTVETWTAVDGSTTQYLYRKLAGGSYVLIATIAGGVQTYTDNQND